MRIAWVTPLAPESAIGEYSRHVAAALAAQPGVDVELWTADPEPLAAVNVPVRRFSDPAAAAGELRDHDAVFHNAGNFLPLHGAIYDLARRRPGIVILHDRVLHHMLSGAWQRDPATFATTYRARLRAYHGERGVRAARELLAGTRPPPWARYEDVVELPLDADMLHGAFGAVTHSTAHGERLRARFAGPVLAMPIPCYRSRIASADAAAPPAPRADGRLQLTTVGHIIGNKHVDGVLALLAADPGLAARVRYSVAGHIDPPYRETLERLLRENPQVDAELLGWCEEGDLDRLLAATDVFANLRHPVFESGSASLARELAQGRPILCFDAGSFGELPADAVVRVPAGDLAAVAAELADLAADPRRRAALGERARQLAAERDETAYARALVGFAGEVLEAAPGLALLDRAAAELARMDADPALPTFDAVARAAAPALRPEPSAR
jgi:glycosyltransferase involved in cell wall biosynthesis